MEKAESLSFPTVIGSGGRKQSLHNEILVGAKPFILKPYFSPDVCPQILILIPTNLYHTLRRVYSTTSFFDIKTHLQPWRTRRKLCQTSQFLPSHLSLALLALLVHNLRAGDGQKWSLANTVTGFTSIATPQPWQRIFRVMMRGSWTSPLNRRGR
jgi:hypothetical protein